MPAVSTKVCLGDGGRILYPSPGPLPRGRLRGRWRLGCRFSAGRGSPDCWRAARSAAAFFSAVVSAAGRMGSFSALSGRLSARGGRSAFWGRPPSGRGLLSRREGCFSELCWAG